MGAANDEPEVLKAARSGDVQMMHFALASFEKAAIDAAKVKETGETALMIAAGRSDADITKLLIEANANLNIVNFNGETALMIAVDNGATEVARLLLEANASKTARNNKGETALDYAARREDMEMFRLLEDREDITADGCVPEVLGNYIKLNEKCPWMELVRKSSKPVHACLMLAERFKDLSEQAQAERARVFEALAKDCISYSRQILGRYYTRMKDQKTQQLLFNTLVGGRSCMMIAAESRFVDFMADDVVQHIVRMLWIGEAGVFETLAMSILFRPWSRPFSYWQDPACFFATARGKFALSTILYILFLGLFTWVVNAGPLSLAPTAVEWAMYYCVLGFIMHEVKQFREAGFRGYFSQTWNKMDSTMYAIFVTCFVFRVVGFFDVAHRVEWARQVMRFMAYNSIFLWMRLLQLCLLDSTLGPLLSMIGNMIRNIFNFMTILGVILLGFGQTFYTLLREDSKYTEDYPHTVLNLFGSLLGTSFGFEDNIAAYSVFGRVLLEIFLMMGSVLLLNLLIAILTNTYAAVKEVSDSEYKYGLAETVLEKIEDSLVVPPPLNAIRFTLIFLPMRFVVGLISALMLLALLPFTAALALFYIATGQRNRVAAFLRTKPDFSFPVETKDDDDDDDDKADGKEAPEPQAPEAAAGGVPGQGAPASVAKASKYHDLEGKGKSEGGSGTATPASARGATAPAAAAGAGRGRGGGGAGSADEWGAIFEDEDYSSTSEEEEVASSVRSVRTPRSAGGGVIGGGVGVGADGTAPSQRSFERERRRGGTGRRERAEIAAQLVEVHRKLALLMQHAGIADGPGGAVPILDPAPISPGVRQSRSSSRSVERGATAPGGSRSGRLSPTGPPQFFVAGGATPAAPPLARVLPHRSGSRSRTASLRLVPGASTPHSGSGPIVPPLAGLGPAPSPPPVGMPVRSGSSGFGALPSLVAAVRAKAAASAPASRESSVHSSSEGTLRALAAAAAAAAAEAPAVQADLAAGLERAAAGEEAAAGPPIAVIDADTSHAAAVDVPAAAGAGAAPALRRVRSSEHAHERTAGRAPAGADSGPRR
eukprot:tig00000498_g1593.t1